MKTCKLHVNTPLFTKLALIFTLMFGMAHEAWGDNVIIYNGESTFPDGWTVSSTTNMTISNNEIVCNNSAPYLQSTSTWTFTDKKLVVVAKRTNDTDAYVRLSEGYSPKRTIGYGSTTSSYELSDDYVELIFDTYSASNVSNLRIYGKNVKIQSIKLCDNRELLIDQDNPTAISKGSKTESIRFKYTAQTGWNTICVPFNLKATYGTAFDYMPIIFGTGYKAFTLSSYASNSITFSTSMTTLSKNVPLLVYAPNALNNEDGVLLSSADITYNKALSTTKGDATFQGTYVTKTYAANDDWYGVTPSGKIMKAGTGAAIKGYRAYFTGISAAAGARLSIVIEDDGETTDLGFVKMVDPEAKDVYTLSGQKVQKAGKGIYIVNGRKVVIK